MTVSHWTKYSVLYGLATTRINWQGHLRITVQWVWCFRLTEIVRQSPSRKFLRGARKLMAAVWMNSLSAAPNLFSLSPTIIKVLPAMTPLRLTTNLSLQVRSNQQLFFKYQKLSLYLCFDQNFFFLYIGPK